MNDFLIEDRKSTRLNSSHGYISYAVFCLKKKTDRDWSDPSARHQFLAEIVTDARRLLRWTGGAPEGDGAPAVRAAAALLEQLLRQEGGGGESRQAFADAGRELVAKVPQESDNGWLFPKRAFVIDAAQETVTCPEGQTTARFTREKDVFFFLFFRPPPNSPPFPDPSPSP